MIFFFIFHSNFLWFPFGLLLIFPFSFFDIFLLLLCISWFLWEIEKAIERKRAAASPSLCMMHTPPVSMRRIRHAASACAPLFLVLSAPKILCFYELPASLTCPSNTPCTTPTLLSANEIRNFLLKWIFWVRGGTAALSRQCGVTREEVFVLDWAGNGTFWSLILFKAYRNVLKWLKNRFLLIHSEIHPFDGCFGRMTARNWTEKDVFERWICRLLNDTNKCADDSHPFPREIDF